MVWASNSSNSVEPRSPPRKKRSRSRPSWVNVMAGLAQRRLMRRQETAPAAAGLGGAGSGMPDNRTESISTGQSVRG